jgi:hypothetical protein
MYCSFSRVTPMGGAIRSIQGRCVCASSWTFERGRHSMAASHYCVLGYPRFQLLHAG